MRVGVETAVLSCMRHDFEAGKVNLESGVVIRSRQTHPFMIEVHVRVEESVLPRELRFDQGLQPFFEYLITA